MHRFRGAVAKNRFVVRAGVWVWCARMLGEGRGCVCVLGMAPETANDLSSPLQLGITCDGKSERSVA